MTIRDTFQETYIALSVNKVRSGLTILGIIIGISSVIALVSIGQGATGSIQSSISSLGSNLIQIRPGAVRTQGFGVSSGRGSAQSLTQDDANAVSKSINSVVSVATEVSGRYQVTAKGTNTNTIVDGVSPSYTSIRNLGIAEGYFISDQQNESYAKVAVIGPTTRDDLFGENATDILNSKIRIKGVEFTVIGVTEAKGGSGFGNQDDVVYIPVQSAQRYLSGNKYVTTIDVQAASASVMDTVQNDITTLLLTRHHISDPTQADFSLLNQNDLLSTASSVTQTLTLLLAAIGGISLLVGGIGIMNMMLTTVTERTREIGLRKAIGAKQKDIRLQFLSESILLTIIGGITGIVLGWGAALVVSSLSSIKTSVSFESVVLAFGVSAIIGIVFGYYPARKAARLNPIEALRYE